MKKRLVAVLSAVCMFTCAFGLAACDTSEGDKGNAVWGEEYSIEAAYLTAQELGYTGSLEEFILAISGKDGKDGENGKDGADGKDGKDGENGLNGINGRDGENGRDGIGVKSASINERGELVVILTDDTEIICGEVRGSDGKDGEDGEDGLPGEPGLNGNSTESGKVNEKGELILTLTDGTEINCGVVKGADGEDGDNGEDGDKGEDGVGIQGARINESGELILILTSNAEINCGVVKGTDGEDGKDGTNGTNGENGSNGSNGRDGKDGDDGKDGVGIQGAQINEEGELILILTNEEEINCGIVKGADGKKGADGGKGEDGASGADGIGISDVVMDANGNLTVTLTNGNSIFCEAQRHEHAYGAEEKVIPASCTTPGVNLHSCACGDVALVRVEPFGHDYEWVPLDEELHIKRCSRCNEQTQWPHEFNESEVCTLCHESKATEGLLFREVKDGETVIGYEVYGIEENHKAEITVPEQYKGKPVTKIADGAFKNDSILEKIVLQDGITAIGKNAFNQCISLEHISLPDTLQSVGAEAFFADMNIKRVDGGSLSSWCAINFKTQSSNPLAYAHKLYLEGVLVTELDFEEITGIGAYAFYGAADLTKITVPASVTAIGAYAFAGCTALNDVTLTAGITTIKEGTFYGCTALRQIAIPASVTKIEESAFEGCSLLEAVTLPSAVRDVGSGAFRDCTFLREIHLSGSVNAFEEDVFSGCTAITDVYFTGDATAWAQISKNCSELTAAAVQVHYLSE